MNRLDRVCDKIDAAFSLDLYPKWFRRTFVILSPIAGPVWMITYMLTIVIAGLLMGIFVLIPRILKDLWQDDDYHPYDGM